MRSESIGSLKLAVRLRVSLSQLEQQLRTRRSPDSPSLAGLAVIAQIHRWGPMTPGALAQRLGVRPQSLTRLLGDLVARGCLARTRVEQDRRRVELHLTPLGSAMLGAEVTRREGSLRSAAEQSLSEEEMRRLDDACRLLERLAEQMASGAPAGVSEPQPSVRGTL